MLISWSEKVKQEWGILVFSLGLCIGICMTWGEKTQETGTRIFTGIDVKIACELNLHSSILVCKNSTRVNGKFFRLGMRLHPEKNLD